MKTAYGPWTLVNSTAMIDLIIAETFLVISSCQAWITTPRTNTLAFQSPNKRFHHHSEFQLFGAPNPSPSGIGVIEGPWDISKFGSSKCWGKQPLLIRNAFDIHQIPVSWEDVFDLSCSSSSSGSYESNDDNGECEEEEDLPPSRVIDHVPGTLDTYRIDFGPFDSEDLESRGLFLSPNNQEEAGKERASTLVVNDVDRYIPQLSDWMDTEFGFIPRWRRDDAQISLAPTDGGIGPHVDNYDVFLIQASGSRLWQVSLAEIPVKDEFDHLVAESQVRILDFTTTTIGTTDYDDENSDTQKNTIDDGDGTAVAVVQIELNPGDCLYLPPRIMHYGSSTTPDCMTLSVGCRAPSAQDLISRIAEDIAISTAPSAVRRYVDDNEDVFYPSSSSSSSTITDGNTKDLSSKIKNQMKDLVTKAINDYFDDDDIWDSLIGRVVTEPNRPTTSAFEYPIPLNEIDDDWNNDPNQILDEITAGKEILRRAEGIAFAWSKSSSSPSMMHQYRLYANGRAFPLIPDWHDDDDQQGNAAKLSFFLDRLANGPPIIDRQVLNAFGFGADDDESSSDDGTGGNIQKLLCELIEKGFLYPESYEDDEEVE